MTIADELKKLQDLRASGGLTDEEFAAAKAAVLGNTDAAPALEAHLQNEVERLDREWQIECQRYMVQGKYGHTYLPNRGMSVLTGIVAVGFGVLWMTMTASMGAPPLFTLFGVLFIAIGIGVSIYTFSKANAYEQAQERYQRRRRALLEQQDKPPQD